MKLNTLITITSLILIVTAAQAQVTMAELKKYAVTMDSIETLKNQLTASINKLSKGNSKITSDRFNTLMPIINDNAKLTEAKAKPDEIAYVRNAAAVRDDESRKFQNAYLSLINDYIGSDVFSKVRNALKSDTTLKRKYDSLMVKPIRP